MTKNWSREKIDEMRTKLYKKRSAMIRSADKRLSEAPGSIENHTALEDYCNFAKRIRKSPLGRVLDNYEFYRGEEGFDSDEFTMTDVDCMLQATNSADRILNDPVVDFIWENGGASENSDMSEDYDNFADRRMDKKTYETYLSKIIGREVTLEEAENIARRLNLDKFRKDPLRQKDHFEVLLRRLELFGVFSRGMPASEEDLKEILSKQGEK